jgi:hypothetical protein
MVYSLVVLFLSAVGLAGYTGLTYVSWTWRKTSLAGQAFFALGIGGIAAYSILVGFNTAGILAGGGLLVAQRPRVVLTAALLDVSVWAALFYLRRLFRVAA